MKKRYEVSLKVVLTCPIMVEAESPEEAKVLASENMDADPFYYIDGNDTSYVENKVKLVRET